jgi:Predicted glycosyltransferases
VADSDAVTVAYVCGNTVIYSWHKSLLELVAYDGANKNRVGRGGYVAQRYGTGELVDARNKVVRTFLEEDTADWLFWVDTDMGFRPDAVDRLLEAADAAERPIVGGLCFFNREIESDGTGGYRHVATPTIYDWVHIEGQYGWQARSQYKVNALTPCDGTGSACVLIHRSVFEKVEAEHGQHWYDRIPNTTTDTLIGEDMSFCLRVRALGIPIFVHTGVPTTHFKQIWLGEEDFWRDVAFKSAAEKISEELETLKAEPAAP